jgi:hypothetical protein
MSDRVDWKEIALAAWQAPSWREAAVDYHKNRPVAPPAKPDPEIWRVAGRYISSKAPRDALRMFLKWCDRRGISQQEAIPIFKTIVDKELAK